MRTTLYNKTFTQGDQGEPGDRGPSGDEYISQSPPPQLTVVPGPKGDQGDAGPEGGQGETGDPGPDLSFEMREIEDEYEQLN